MIDMPVTESWWAIFPLIALVGVLWWMTRQDQPPKLRRSCAETAWDELVANPRMGAEILGRNGACKISRDVPFGWGSDLQFEVKFSDGSYAAFIMGTRDGEVKVIGGTVRG